MKDGETGKKGDAEIGGWGDREKNRTQKMNEKTLSHP
jgi:hypothetical protein